MRHLSIKSLSLVLVVSLLFFSLFAVSAMAQEKAEYVAKYSESWPVGSPRVNAAEVFKTIAEKASGGRIKVEVYPSGQLGIEKNTTEALKTGVLQVTRGAFYSKANPRLNLFIQPFLFDNFEQAKKALGSPIAKEARENAKKNGFYIPAMGFQPPRVFTSNKGPIETPSDLKGLDIRVPGVDVDRRTMSALGANPQNIPFTETYMALKQGVVDAQENPVIQIKDMKFYEVQDYMTLLGWRQEIDPIMISLKWYNSLPEDLQEVVTFAAEKSQEYLNWAYTTQKERYEEFLRGEMEVNTVPKEDISLFADKAKSVWQYYINRGHFTQEDIDEMRSYVENQ